MNVGCRLKSLASVRGLSLRTGHWKLKTVLAVFAFLLFIEVMTVFPADASSLYFNSLYPGDNSSTYNAWSSAVGINGASIQYSVDFETGFVNGQVVSQSAAFPGGMIADDQEHNLLIAEGSGSIAASNPIGSFALLAHGTTVFDFSANPVDYFGFYSMDKNFRHWHSANSTALKSFP